MNPTVRSQLYLSALGILTGDPFPGTRRDIARRIKALHDPQGNFSLGQIENIVRQATDNHYLAERMQADPTEAYSRSAHGYDPSCNAAGGGYCYRVVVDVTDEAGNVHSTAFTIQEAYPLSAADIQAEAINRFSQGNFMGESPRARQLAEMARSNIEVTVISAGRG